MTSTCRFRSAATLVAVSAGLLGSACGSPAPSASADVHVGSVVPMRGAQAPAAADESLGIRIAARLTNADGGIGGRRLVVDERDLSTADDAPQALAAVQAAGAQMVLGTYASDLSMVASREAGRLGMVYWEAGAVADRITGDGLPLVFRVGATGSNLGQNSVAFAATQLSPRLGVPASRLRVSLVLVDDLYAHSVADAARREAEAVGMSIVSTSTYSLLERDFHAAVADLRAARPDVLVLSSHVDDGVAFRRAFLAAGLHVGAFIGSTMAECGPDFGRALGTDAIGVFASDRPDATFDPGLLRPEGRTAFARLAAAWSAERGGARPSEEGVAAFSAAWALFRDVLPVAASAGTLDAAGVAAAARGVDLPSGSLPDGAGLRFSSATDRLGQNLRSSAVIWQWQGFRHSVVVWPPGYATGTVAFVPLPR